MDENVKNKNLDLYQNINKKNLINNSYLNGSIVDFVFLTEFKRIPKNEDFVIENNDIRKKINESIYTHAV